MKSNNNYNKKMNQIPDPTKSAILLLTIGTCYNNLGMFSMEFIVYVQKELPKKLIEDEFRMRLISLSREHFSHHRRLC